MVLKKKKTNSTKDVKGYHFQKLSHPNGISCLFLDPNDKPIKALNESHVVTLIPRTYFRITLTRKINIKTSSLVSRMSGCLNPVLWLYFYHQFLQNSTVSIYNYILPD